MAVARDLSNGDSSQLGTKDEEESGLHRRGRDGWEEEKRGGTEQKAPSKA